MGNSGVPFMNSTSAWLSISAWMRSITDMVFSPAWAARLAAVG